MRSFGRPGRRLPAAAGVLIGSLTVLSCRSLPVDLASAWLGLPEPGHAIRTERNVRIPMRDGVVLEGDLYRPRRREKVPAVLIRTPYGKRNPLYRFGFQGELLASHGYAVLVQDVRGKYRSGGEFYPLFHEEQDGKDTIAWLAGQRWCSGRVALLGGSYSGCAAWLAAPDAGEALAAVVPVFAAQSAYRTWLSGGAFRLEMVYAWHQTYDVRTSRPLSIMDWRKGVWNLPLITADDRTGRNNPVYDDWISHPRPGPFWRTISVDHRSDRIRCPALLVAGWFDPFLNPMLEDFDRLRRSGTDPVAGESRLIVGPWTHVADSRFADADFGDQAGFATRAADIVRWLDGRLKEGAGADAGQAPIRIFVMGANRWRDEREWPPARARYTRFYLHSGGGANSAEGDGRLSGEPPAGEEAPDVFTYDPAAPVPSRSRGSSFSVLAFPPEDQQKVESRPDVLVYTSAPLEEDLEVTGPVRLELYAASTAPDTDFTARLADVHPDGRSILVTSGIVRARCRDSLARSSPLEPGRVYRYSIELGATSNVFLRGHRLRLQVSSSDFPRYDRNLNTGMEPGAALAVQSAEQTVRHDAGQPSCLVLPVIPGR